MKNNDDLYFRIDHKNKMSFLSESERISFSVGAFMTLAAIDDDCVGSEINKFFDKLIPNNKADLMEINISQTKQYLKKYNYTTEEFNKTVNTILAKNNKNIFVFNTENTLSTARVLTYVFKFLFDKKGKKYGVKTYSNLKEKIDSVHSKNIDVISWFVDKTKARNKSSMISSPGSSDKKLNNQNSFSQTEQTNSLFNEYLNDVRRQSNSYEADIYQYPQSSRIIKPNELDLPIEMIILLNKFIYIKKLVFSIDNMNRQRVHEILLILLNREWLFPNVIDVEFELNNEDLLSDLSSVFDYRINKLTEKYEGISKTTSYNSGFKPRVEWNPSNEEKKFQNEFDFSNTSNFGMSFSSISCYDGLTDIMTLKRTETTPSEEEFIKLSKVHKETSHTNVIKKYFTVLEAVIIYSYFIGKINKAKILSLIFNKTLSTEIEMFLKMEGIILVNFHFLNFLSTISELSEMSIVFNSLDVRSFEKLLGIINKNSSLHKLRFSPFASEENYSPGGLFELFSALKNKKSKESIHSLITSNSQNSELDYLILNCLMLNFEENIEKFFFVLQSLKVLNEIIFFLDLPSLIANNDEFLMILIKFFLNFLTFLSLENKSIKTFKLIAPYLKFDNRRFPIIDGLLEDINLQKNQNIDVFFFQIQMYYVSKVPNLIPMKVTRLFLGDLDASTFESFVNFFCTKEYLEKSELMSVKVSLSPVVIIYEKVEDNIKKFLLHKTENMIEQMVLSYVKIRKPEDIKSLFNLVHYQARTKRIVVEIGKSNEEDLKRCLWSIKEELINKMIVIHEYFSEIIQMKDFNKKRKIIMESIIKIKSFLFLGNDKNKILTCKK